VVAPTGFSRNAKGDSNTARPASDSTSSSMTWIVDAHGYGKRFIVRADEKLTAFWNLNQH